MMRKINKIEELTCCICKKKVTGRKLLLSTPDDEYLCESCFFKIPEGLHRKLCNNSENHNGQEFNKIIIQALKQLPRGIDLNDKYVLLLFGCNTCRFEKFEFLTLMKQARETYEKRGIQCLYAFNDGRIRFSTFPY